MSLITVIPFNQSNAEQAEKLIDWIYQLNDKKPKGIALVVADFDIHAESREKIKISCELAFEQFEVVRLSSALGDGNKLNQTFRRIGEYVKGAYRSSFFWLEPDSLPLVKGWQKVLEAAYNAQQKRYFSAIETRGEQKYISRHGIYPPNAIDDVSKWLDSKEDFNVAAGQGLVWRTGGTNLLDYAGISSPVAVVSTGDKDGQFLQSLKDSNAS